MIQESSTIADKSLDKCCICQVNTHEELIKTSCKVCKQQSHRSCLEGWWKEAKSNIGYTKYPKNPCPYCRTSCASLGKVKKIYSRCIAITYKKIQCCNKQKYGKFCGIHNKPKYKNMAYNVKKTTESKTIMV